MGRSLNFHTRRAARLGLNHKATKGTKTMGPLRGQAMGLATLRVLRGFVVRLPSIRPLDMGSIARFRPILREARRPYARFFAFPTLRPR
jgi:hypothetical protein